MLQSTISLQQNHNGIRNITVFCANHTPCLYIIYIGGFQTILLAFLSTFGPISRYPLLEKDSLNAPAKELKGVELR